MLGEHLPPLTLLCKDSLGNDVPMNEVPAGLTLALRAAPPLGQVAELAWEASEVDVDVSADLVSSACQPVSLSILLSVPLSVCPSVRLSVRLFVCPSVFSACPCCPCCAVLCVPGYLCVLLPGWEVHGRPGQALGTTRFFTDLPAR